MQQTVDKQLVTLQQSFDKIKLKLKSVSDLLNQERDNIAYDEENFVSSLDKIKHVHFPREKIISLNVGGTIFCTSYETLNKRPSMLQAMFSGRHELHPMKDGTHFFDRDPKVFKYVINFLRNDKIDWPDNGRLKKLIQIEFDYFAIDCQSNPEVFVQTGDFDKKGFLYWLGTDGGTTTWTNPRVKKLVEVESDNPRYYRIINNSAERYDNVEDLSLVVDYNSDPPTCVTSPSAQSGFTVDFKDYTISITVITLSCYYSPTTYLTSMNFRGSIDKTTWFPIPVVEGTLIGKVRSFKVTGSLPQFRYLSIKNQTYQCLVSGMELYGNIESR